MRFTKELLYEALLEIGLAKVNGSIREYQHPPIDDFQRFSRFSWNAKIDMEIVGDVIYSSKGMWPSNNRIARSVMWTLLLRRRPENEWLRQTIFLYHKYPNAKSLHHALLLEKWNTFKARLILRLFRK